MVTLESIQEKRDAILDIARRYGADPEIELKISERLRQALKTKQELEKLMGVSLKSILINK